MLEAVDDLQRIEQAYVGDAREGGCGFHQRGCEKRTERVKISLFWTRPRVGCLAKKLGRA
jgi:hypothetical protein